MSAPMDKKERPHQWFCRGKKPCACMDSWKAGGWRDNAILDRIELDGKLVYDEEVYDHVDVKIGDIDLIEYLVEKLGVKNEGEGSDRLYRFGRVRIIIEKLPDLEDYDEEVWGNYEQPSNNPDSNDNPS